MKKSVAVLFLIVFACALTLALTACGGSADKAMLQASEIAYLSEIQEKDNLVFEWLRAYNPEKPTLVVVHGERTGKGTEAFSISLDENVYTFKTDASTDYVVPSGTGYKGKGLDLHLENYWLNVASFNVVIFHWERFADEESDNVLAKVFSVPKMKYVTDDGRYETNAVPKNPLYEVFSALYVKEFADKSLKQEMRWVGNGVGADLIAAAAQYMLGYVKEGVLDGKYLPDRITLCDPYLSTEDLHLSGNKTTYGVSSTDGAMSIVTDFVTAYDPYGAIEVVESDEVTTTDDGTTNVYAYPTVKNEKSENYMKELKKHVAYLELRESYSKLFDATYKAQKRIALDWYLYSIIGSDDTGNAGGTYAMGYPRNLSDYQTYLSYSGFNWGTNETRPMVNNRALNNDASVSNASTRGKNLCLSAWTPTSYTKGLTGVSFTMKKSSGKSTLSDVHGNAVYTYPATDYVTQYFRSETFQVSDEKKTTVCGYVYLDENKNGYIDDGNNGVKNAHLYVTLTEGEKVVATMDVYTDESGYYSFSFADGTEDSEGDIVDGYSFATTHTVTIELEPNSHSYVPTASALTGQFYDLLSGNNFAGYKGTVTLDNTVADNTVVANCLVKPVG